MRINTTEKITVSDFDTIRVEVTTKPNGVVTVYGFLKDERTGLPDMVLFDDEDRLGALVDDLTEALELVSKERRRRDDGRDAE